MRYKKGKMGLVTILVTGLLFLSGCWGKHEVEELAPLIGMGIDLGQKPGTYLITGQFLKPQKGGQSGSEVVDRTVSVEASSGREAFEKMYKVFYRTPFMGSLRVIVIGEDVAKAGFKDLLDFVQRYSDFRRSMYLVLAKGKAQSILNLKLRTGQIPAMRIKNHIEEGEELSGFPTVRLGHYLTVLGTKSTAPILPVIEGLKSGEGVEYKTEGNDEAQEIRIQGAGVLRGTELVDFLTDEETKGYMWLENDVIRRFISTVELEREDVKFAGQVIRSSTKYKVVNNDGTTELQYHIKARIAVDEVLGLEKKLSELEWAELLKGAEQSFAKVIEKECMLAIQKEKALKLDFLGIGRHIEQKDSAYWKTIKENWEEEIKDFPISLNIQVIIKHSGISGSSVLEEG